jgi:Relaxase/Mobilisation nuclease domain
MNRASREPLFDLMSYARHGPGGRDRLSPAQIEQIARTTSRTPEVMLKVLPTAATSLKAVRKHIEYIGRDGDLNLETDDSDKIRGVDLADDLLEDWDLDLDDHRRRSDLVATRGKGPPRLVHKLMFSMPAGTPPDKVLGAVRNFCREEFALKHRYVMALHTDEPHPHVHVVLKAVSEQGERLHIRKATLREWRSEFARHLRELGVPANATQRFVRGETKPQKTDGIYRAALRGQSTHMRNRAEAVATELLKGTRVTEPAKAALVRTRSDVESAWGGVSEALRSAGRSDVAAEVGRFIDRLEPPRTDRERIEAALIQRAREPRVQKQSKTL